MVLGERQQNGVTPPPAVAKLTLFNDAGFPGIHRFESLQGFIDRNDIFRLAITNDAVFAQGDLMPLVEDASVVR